MTPPGAPLRVALVGNALGIGGLERIIVDLGRGLTRRGFQVRLFLLTAGGPWLAEPGMEELAPRVLSGRSSWKPRDLRHNLACLWELARALRDFSPDVIQTHLFFSEVMGAIAARLIPGCRTFHVEQNRYPWKNRAVSAFERVLAGGRGAWICPTEHVAGDVAGRLGLPRDRVHVIPNGVRVGGSPAAVGASGARRRARERLGLPQDGFVVGTFERMVEQKNHPQLVEAIAHVARREPRTRWVLAGDGPGRCAIERAIRERGLERFCVLAGELEDPGWILPALDVYATASLREGFGISVAEAAAFDRPLVLPDLPVFRETMGEDRAAFFPAGSVAGMVARLEWIRSRPTEAAAMGRRGRMHVARRYDPETMVSRYAALYRAGCASPEVSRELPAPRPAGGNSFDFIQEVL